MLRSLPLGARSHTASLLASTGARRTLSSPFISSAPAAACLHASRTTQQSRHAHAHAISNPTLAGIEKRWEAMPPQEQAELWMALRDRMKADWHELTLQEKKAAYWIAFGPHGPRALPPPDERRVVALYTLYGIGAALGIVLIARQFAKPPPTTMTKAYQEQSNEYLKNQNTEPITGFSAEGYKGHGMVQSAKRRD